MWEVNVGEGASCSLLRGCIDLSSNLWELLHPTYNTSHLSSECDGSRVGEEGGGGGREEARALAFSTLIGALYPIISHLSSISRWKS